jgi:hypothetical protein
MTETASQQLAQDFVETYGKPLGIKSRFPRDQPRVMSVDGVREGAQIFLHAYHGIGPRERRSARFALLGDSQSLESLTTLQRKLRGRFVPPTCRELVATHYNRPGFRITVREEWNQGIRDIARLVAGKDLRFLLRLAPIRNDSQSENFEDLRAWLKTLQADLRHAVVKQEILFYDRSLCWNRTHLNKEGIKRFSRVVADDLRPVAKDSRSLPAPIGESLPPK